MIMKNILITFFTVLFFMTSSVVWSETMDDLVYRDGLYYKKFTEVPFTGKTTGQHQGSFKNGKGDGSWIRYHDNGQLDYKGDYKNGKSEGSWISYHDNGLLMSKGDYKNGNQEGSWVGYMDDGQLRYKGDFKNGKREGSWVIYEYDGSVDKVNSGTYKDGIKIN